MKKLPKKIITQYNVFKNSLNQGFPKWAKWPPWGPFEEVRGP